MRNFVKDEVNYNDQAIGFRNYRDISVSDGETIPDLRLTIGIVVVDGAYAATRLLFDYTPLVTFVDLAVDGRKVKITENVFYWFHDGKIDGVWSVVDKTAVAAQIKYE